MNEENGRADRAGRVGRVGKPYMDEADLKRNCLTIRFKDEEHRAVTDEAWRNRKTASGWLRDLVLERLELLATGAMGSVSNQAPMK